MRLTLHGFGVILLFVLGIAWTTFGVFMLVYEVESSPKACACSCHGQK